MTYRGYTIKRTVREISIGRYPVYSIIDNQNITREIAASEEVAKYVIDVKISHGQWPELEVKGFAG